MREAAEARVEDLLATLDGIPPAAITPFEPDFHEGVVGIVASRIKDRCHRPTFVFARGADGQLKGSGRSIPGFHLRDALDLVSKREPELLAKFGGHAMAAGATLRTAGDEGIARFEAAMRQVASEWLDAESLTRVLRHDGPLAPDLVSASTARLLDTQVWGQGFEAPLFCDRFQVLSQRLVGERHLKLRLSQAGTQREAIWFGRTEPVAQDVTLAYRLSLDEWQGQLRVQFVVEAQAA